VKKLIFCLVVAGLLAGRGLVLEIALEPAGIYANDCAASGWVNE